MSLIRITDRKLAANRANAQKSTGPRTAEGKAASAQNNSIHYLYARKFTVPPKWHAEMTALSADLSAGFSDPIERELRKQWLYTELWIERLNCQEARLCRLEIRNSQGDSRRGVFSWVHTNPLFRAWLRRLRQLTRHAERLL